MFLMSTIKYPGAQHPVIKGSNVMDHHSKRGMFLENDVNESNQYYRECKRALIYKKPTPITINKVDYHSRYDATIKEAHFKIP